MELKSLINIERKVIIYYINGNLSIKLLYCFVIVLLGTGKEKQVLPIADLYSSAIALYILSQHLPFPSFVILSNV